MTGNMDPAERTLQVPEYLMAADPGPIKQVDIARECGLSTATLNRIMKSLSDWGYLFRSSEKYCVRNFRLERNVPYVARLPGKALWIRAIELLPVLSMYQGQQKSQNLNTCQIIHACYYRCLATDLCGDSGRTRRLMKFQFTVV